MKTRELRDDLISPMTYVSLDLWCYSLSRAYHHCRSRSNLPHKRMTVIYNDNLSILTSVVHCGKRFRVVKTYMKGCDVGKDHRKGIT